jgi:hypothetical protein
MSSATDRTIERSASFSSVIGVGTMTTWTAAPAAASRGFSVASSAPASTVSATSSANPGSRST